MTIQEDVQKMTDAQLQQEVTTLRGVKERTQEALRAVVAEIDRRAMIADARKRYGDKADQILKPTPHVVSGVGGIDSKEFVNGGN